jgi:hypothetical protein
MRPPKTLQPGPDAARGVCRFHPRLLRKGFSEIRNFVRSRGFGKPETERLALISAIHFSDNRLRQLNRQNPN